MSEPADRLGGVIDAVEVRRRLGAVAQARARAVGITPATQERLAEIVPLFGSDGAANPGGVAGDASLLAAGSLGERHQSLLDDGHRRRRGVHYTPAAVATLLAGRTLGPSPLRPGDAVPAVCDPSCGGGAFLRAVADHLHRAGADPTAVLADALHGLDLDPLAVEVARVELVLWAAAAGVSDDHLVEAASALAAHVRVGDALTERWPADGRLDAVVGNPPFAGQLSRVTARDPAQAGAARELLGTTAGYADTAGLFLARAVRAASSGGRVALIQPLSFLGARDAGVVRRWLSDHAVLEEVWFADQQMFQASVDVCAPMLRVAERAAVAATSPVNRSPAKEWSSAAPDASPASGIEASGVEVTVGPIGSVAVTIGAPARRVAVVDGHRLERAGSWAPLAAAGMGVPLVELDGRPHLGRWATATAGFRDEFYALVPFVQDLLGEEPVVESAGATRSSNPTTLPPGHARLVTSGLIDPARTTWGERTTRFAGRRLQAPAVDIGALRRSGDGPGGDRRLSAWADARLRPKLVVAAQTRVVEVAVDEAGDWWPSVPVISVVLRRDPAGDEDVNGGDGGSADVRPSAPDLWMLAAALAAPPVTAWAAEQSAGTALGRHALKLSARQIAEVPLPVDREAWAAGAAELREVAIALTEAARARHLAAAGRLLTAAHDLPPALAAEVFTWWATRVGLAPTSSP